MTHTTRSVLLLAALAATSSVPSAQTPAAGTPAAPAARAAAPAPAPIRVGSVTIAGSLRVRGEGWDWFDAPGYDDRYAYAASLLRVSAAYVRPRFDVLVEASQPMIVGLPDNAVAPAPQGQLGLGGTYRAENGSDAVAGLFLKQAFVRFRGLGDPANAVRVGRMEFGEGAETAPKDAALAWVKRERIAQRLIGSFGFTHAQRSFDAVHAVRDTRRANLTLFAGLPTEGVFQVDGQGTLEDVRIGYAAVTLPSPATDVRLFGAHYRDGRRLVPTDNRALAVRAVELREVEVNTLGAHVLHVAPTGAGKVDLLLWGAVQGGEWGSQEHRAHAVAAEAGVQPAAPLRPWLRVGYFRGSGDPTPETTAGGEHGTFFQILPTPRGYARTPYYNLMNNQDVFAQLVLRPSPRATLRGEAHMVTLAERRDLWYAGGGAFDERAFGFQGRPSNGERELGTVLDLSVDYQLRPTTSLTLYGGRVFGGGVVSRVYPTGDDMGFAYVEVAHRF